MVAARVLRDFGSERRARSSSSTTRRTTATRTSCSSIPTRTADKEDRGAQPRRPGLVPGPRAICAARSGIKAVYDLSATPYYLKGSGYNEGFIFPWVVSDFSLMDAIESGIVKVPRIPVDDDAAGEQLVYLHLWDHIEPPLPKRKSATDARRRRRAGYRRRRSRARCAASTAATSSHARYERRAGARSASRRR